MNGVSGRPVPSVVAASLIVAACSTAGGDGGADGGGVEIAERTATAAIETSAVPAPEEQAQRLSAVVGLVVLAPVPTHVLSATGFKDSAADCEAVDIEVIERNASGDLTALEPLTEGLLQLDVDLVATVTTPAAEAAHKVVGAAGGTTPVVFATVTDPFSAGLAEDPSTHEPWITGSASPPPVGAVMDAAQEIVPGLDAIGVIRNPAESNSQFAVQGIMRAAGERGITVDIEGVTESAETGDAARALIERSIDAFVIPTDTTVYAGLGDVVELAGEYDIPVIGIDPNQAELGAAIGLGSDYYGSGFRAGGIACRVLSGAATPADFDIVDIETLGITVNEASIAAQNVTIPQHLRELAETTG